MCPLLPHWIRASLYDQQNALKWQSFTSKSRIRGIVAPILNLLFWGKPVTCSKALNQPFGESQIEGNWDFLPTARTNFLALWVSRGRSRSSSPSHTFRWPQPWSACDCIFMKAPKQNHLVKLLPNFWPMETVSDNKWLLLGIPWQSSG